MGANTDGDDDDDGVDDADGDDGDEMVMMMTMTSSDQMNVNAIESNKNNADTMVKMGRAHRKRRNIGTFHKTVEMNRVLNHSETRGELRK